MKTSDYIAQFLADQGVADAFVLTGGCIVHVIDSIARNGKTRYISVQHEQAGAMAADAYSRITGNGLTSREFANLMLDKAGIALLPGTDLGEFGEGYVRLCYAVSEDAIVEGIQHMRHTLAAGVRIRP